MSLGSYFGTVWLVRLLLQRALGAIYFVAFLSALLQFPALLGEHGFLPVPDFVRRARFRDAPSLFIWRYSDRLFRVVAWIGLIASLVAISGAYEGAALWLVMWVLYLFIVNV